MSTAPPPTLRTVIVGDAFAAALVATALARHQHAATRPVTVVQLPRRTDDAAWPVDVTLPSHALPRVSAVLKDDALLSAAGAFSWGVALSGFAGADQAGFLPFGSVGAPFGPVAFQHVVQQLRRGGDSVRMTNYALAALAAQAGRFQRPLADPRSVLSTAEHGLHLDLTRATEPLRHSAERLGVTFESSANVELEQDAAGRFQAVRTADGRRITGDLLIDVSRSGLATVSRDPQDWHDWSSWLRADRLLTAHVTAMAAPEPYSEAHAMPGGWARRVALRGRTDLRAHFSSAFQDDTRMHALLHRLAGAPVQDLRIQHVRTGRRAEPWRHNMLTLGPAAVSTDPLVVSDLQLLCVGVELLLQYLPASTTDMQAEATEFNRRFGGHADHARDLSIAPYWLNGRVGEPFWDAVRGMDVPESLAAKHALYAARGQIALYDDEPLEQWGWITLFDELGVRPRQVNALAQYIPDAQLSAHAAKARARMLEAIARMPAHGDYLAALQVAMQGNRG